MTDQAWDEIAAQVAEISHGCPATAERWRKAMPLLNPAAWADTTEPERQWALLDWIPARQATYFTGPGSAGKSLLTQQLCTCIALGLPFMGVETRQAVALYLTCEDDADELHRRQKAICKALGVSLHDLAGKLHLVSLAGHLAPELATFDHATERDEFGELSPSTRTTPQWDALRGTALAIGAGFIGLDNVAHLFAGNENVRHEVASFVSLLNRLAIDIDGSVLFIGHPNKAGDSFSGSTAWENQVRSRLFLESPKDADGAAVDPDARVLSRQKSNYARNGEKLAFRWHHMAFVRDEDLPPDHRAEIALNVQANAENAAFMRCLASTAESRRAVSASPSAASFAPRVFAKMPEAKGVDSKAFERAMERLFSLGEIAADQPLWQRQNRAWVHGLKSVEKCTTHLAPHPCTEAHATSSQVIEIACTEAHAPHPLYTTYINGAAPGAPAPDDIDWGNDR